jgi:hypothetical protein
VRSLHAPNPTTPCSPNSEQSLKWRLSFGRGTSRANETRAGCSSPRPLSRRAWFDCPQRRGHADQEVLDVRRFPNRQLFLRSEATFTTARSCRCELCIFGSWPNSLLVSDWVGDGLQKGRRRRFTISIRFCDSRAPLHIQYERRQFG